jgi:hypothetical protein
LTKKLSKSENYEQTIVQLKNQVLELNSKLSEVNLKIILILKSKMKMKVRI